MRDWMLLDFVHLHEAHASRHYDQVQASAISLQGWPLTGDEKLCQGLKSLSHVVVPRHHPCLPDPSPCSRCLAR